MIRLVDKQDIYRLAEIIVYNNRINYYPIFNDINYSFKLFNVKDLGDQYLNDNAFLNNTYVYDDNGIIKGFIYIKDKEVLKLYVDSFFQNNGIGGKLLNFAIEKYDVNELYVLEKNIRAISFYNRHGFKPTDIKVLEEGTSEYLVLFNR